MRIQDMVTTLLAIEDQTSNLECYDSSGTLITEVVLSRDEDDGTMYVGIS